MLSIQKYNLTCHIIALFIVFYDFYIATIVGLPALNITPSVILKGQKTMFVCTDTDIDETDDFTFYLKSRRGEVDENVAIIPSQITRGRDPYNIKPYFEHSKLQNDTRATILIRANTFVIEYKTTICGDAMSYKCVLQRNERHSLESLYPSLLIIDNSQPITFKMKGSRCRFTPNECSYCNYTKQPTGVGKVGREFTIECSKNMPFPHTGTDSPNKFRWYIERNGVFQPYDNVADTYPKRIVEQTTAPPNKITYGCEDNLELHTSTLIYTPTIEDGIYVRIKCEIAFKSGSLAETKEAITQICILGTPISTTHSTTVTTTRTTPDNISSETNNPESATPEEPPNTPNHNLITIIAASIPVGIVVFGVIIAICVVMVRRERRIMKCIRASESGSGTPTPSDDIVLSTSRISHLTQPSDVTQTQSRLSRFSATIRDHTDIDDDCRSRGAMCTDSDYIAGERSKFNMINDKRKKVGIYIDMGKPTARKAYRPRDDIEMENMNSADRIIMDHASLNKNNNQKGGGRKIRIDYEDGYLEMNTESGSIRIKPNRNDYKHKKRVQYVGDDGEVKDGGGKDGVRFGPADGAENGCKARSQMIDVNGRGGGGKKAVGKTMSM